MVLGLFFIFFSMNDCQYFGRFFFIESLRGSGLVHDIKLLFFLC